VPNDRAARHPDRSPDLVNIDAALGWLDGHINLEATAGKVEGLSLKRMRALTRIIGDPQVDFPAIHITGTNGKGSTAVLTARLLVAQGLSVGTYSSPHVSLINERLAWNGENIDDDTLADLLTTLREVEPHLEATPSWFELLTAAAFKWFADIAVDVAVVEVGKLGRYDATNVVESSVAVVTNIGDDHNDQSPGWKEAIAWEKAGIIKAGASLVLGEPDPALRAVFEAESPVKIAVREIDYACEQNLMAVGGRALDLRTSVGSYEDVFLSLHGAYQGENAATALVAAEEFLGLAVADDAVEEAFGGAVLPGRFEIIGREPLVIIDGAHNPDGAEAVAQTLVDDFNAAGATILVVGMTRERDAVAMLTALRAERSEMVLCCTAPSPRGLPADELAQVADSMGIPAESAGDVSEAVRRAMALAGPDDIIFVAGSLYVAGAARDAYPALVD
jgi:dihydrofolate synthase/folylpolyglutamate synthase